MNIDDRMKRYEAATRFQLTARMPVVIRLDGKAFHTFTKGCERPFDAGLRGALTCAAQALLEEVPARFAYAQSDEISLLLVDYNKFESQQWFDGFVQKMASVSASVMTGYFNRNWGGRRGDKINPPGFFDARVFPIPERDVENHFVWRQQDAMRNAVSMAAQAHFPHKELQGKHTGQMLGMLSEKGIKFEDYPAWFRLGSIITREAIDAAPVFTQDKLFLKKFLTVEEE